MKKLRPFVNHPNFALILLIVINVLVGLFTFQNFGLSWDEPLFYKYADAVGYAYTLAPHLDGSFDVTKTYGPDESHRMYGPAYILAGRGLVYLAENLTGLDRGTLWHAVNFLFFQVGLVFLYLLCRRWVSHWAAFAATLLFNTQPLLWGHAFINPKDIPFTVMFTVALYYGLRMVDRLNRDETPLEPVTEAEATAWQNRRRRLMRWGFAAFVLALLMIVLNGALQAFLRGLMAAVYAADPGSLWGWAFHSVAEDAGKVGVDYYAGQLIRLYGYARAALLVLLLPLAALGGGAWAWPQASLRFWRGVGGSLRRVQFWPRGLRFGAVLRIVWLPGILLGLTASIRILGPVVGAFTLLYFLLRAGRRPLGAMLVYAGIAILVMFLTWPYLWVDPFGNFWQVVRHMSSNPLTVLVLFGGQEYASTALPHTYLPTMMGLTLTETVWPIFSAGLVLAGARMLRKKMDWRDFAVVMVWFFLFFIYVLITQPPMYDGFRHFLFILPPVFVTAGFFFETLSEWFQRAWVRWALLALAVLPGILGIVRLHPYEYAFYNSYAGGQSGVFRQYETDYWLTCYAEAMQPLNQRAAEKPVVYVLRQPALAAIYAAEGVEVRPYKPAADVMVAGDYLLLTTRTNRDLTSRPEAPILWTVGRGGAQYCVMKQVQ